MPTEQEARDMEAAIKAFQIKDGQVIQDKFNTDKAIAITWFDTNILPTLTWNNTQPLDIQRVNILVDFRTLENLLTTETDRFRLLIIKEQKDIVENTFIRIKEAINAAGNP